MDVSILVACLGDYSPIIEAIDKCNTDYTYEICVCSDIRVPKYAHDFRIHFFQDQGTSVKSYNTMFKYSTGQYVICVGGSIIPPENMFDLVDELKRQEQAGKKMAITAMRAHDGGARIPVWAAEMAGMVINDRSTPRPNVLRWPAFSRKTVNEYLDGVVFNQYFKHHWVDNWIGAFCFFQNEPKQESMKVLVDDKEKKHKPISKHDDHDLKVFEGLLKKYKEKQTYNFNPLEE